MVWLQCSLWTAVSPPFSLEAETDNHDVAASEDGPDSDEPPPGSVRTLLFFRWRELGSRQDATRQAQLRAWVMPAQ